MLNPSYRWEYVLFFLLLVVIAFPVYMYFHFRQQWYSHKTCDHTQEWVNVTGAFKARFKFDFIRMHQPTFYTCFRFWWWPVVMLGRRAVLIVISIVPLGQLEVGIGRSMLLQLGLVAVLALQVSLHSLHSAQYAQYYRSLMGQLRSRAAVMVKAVRS